MCEECHEVTNKLIKKMCVKCYKKHYRKIHQQEIHNYNISQKAKNSKKKYYDKNKKQLYEKNSYSKRKEYIQQWRQDNLIHCREWKKQYERNRREKDNLYRMKEDIRNHINQCFIRNKFGIYKDRPTEVILGCSFEEFREYIENQFEPGMSWDNHGQWHLDHIKPLSMAQTEEEVYTLCHYTNYQPLWALDNLRKSNIY